MLDTKPAPGHRLPIGHLTFSPVLFAGLLLRPMPRAPLQLLAAAVLRQMKTRYAPIFSRLLPLGAVTIVLDPIDLPFSVCFRPNARRTELSILDGQSPPADCTIRGPLHALISLLQGETDADAMFFARSLSVEGDMSIALTLRHAIDGQDINLAADFSRALGLPRQITDRVVRLSQSLTAAARRDLAILQAAINAPLAAELERHDAALKQFHAEATVPLAIGSTTRRQRP